MIALPPLPSDRVALVAVDGVDGAGKTHFASALAGELARTLDRPVIRASVDSFHHPTARRYARGRDSPVGYWLDSFDYDAFRHDLLDPLRPGGSRRYRTASHDLATDGYVDGGWRVADPRAVLVVDGVFLLRDELRSYWDVAIFLHVPFEVTARRMAVRDGTHPDPSHPSMARYVEGQRLYLAACDPASRADVLVDNTDWDAPVVLRG